MLRICWFLMGLFPGVIIWMICSQKLIQILCILPMLFLSTAGIANLFRSRKGYKVNYLKRRFSDLLLSYLAAWDIVAFFAVMMTTFEISADITQMVLRMFLRYVLLNAGLTVFFFFLQNLRAKPLFRIKNKLMPIFIMTMVVTFSGNKAGFNGVFIVMFVFAIALAVYAASVIPDYCMCRIHLKNIAYDDSEYLRLYGAAVKRNDVCADQNISRK